MRQEFRSLVREIDGLAVHAVASSEPTPADSPVVVLVHGLALSHRYMMPLARALAARGCRVYVPDLPGFGGSGHPAGTLDVADLAEVLAEWMTAADVPRASMVGNSFGCQIIAELAARWPMRVQRLVLQGPTTPPGERNPVHQFIRWRQNGRFNPPELEPMTSDDYRRAGYGRAWRTFRLGLRDRIEDKVDAIGVPVLFVRGQRDPISPAQWMQEMAARPADGRMAEIPGVAHTLCFTAPQALATLTRGLLDEESPAQWDRTGAGAGP